MSPLTAATDEDLLLAGDSAAFGIFYDRYARMLTAYFMRRTSDPEVAADLTAETFASAIVAQRRYKPGRAPAVSWLFTIAHRRLVDYQRRGAVEARMRRTLALERPPLSQEDVVEIRLLADEAVNVLMADLPDDQRTAVAAYVLDDRGYPEIAVEQHSSEAAVRQRVSRGLGTMRRRLGRRP
jgi:RNA polymerase sigma-70 factor (ECF subfamily)